MARVGMAEYMQEKLGSIFTLGVRQGRMEVIMEILQLIQEGGNLIEYLRDQSKKLCDEGVDHGSVRAS